MSRTKKNSKKDNSLGLDLSDFFKSSKSKSKTKKNKKTHNKLQYKLNHKSVSNYDTVVDTKLEADFYKNYNQDKTLVTQIIDSFYSLNSPIASSLIHYNDKTSKSLNRNALSNFKLCAPFAYDSFNNSFDDMNKSYEEQQTTKQNAGIKGNDLPQPIKYATEDFTRGLAYFLNLRYPKLPVKVSNTFGKLWEVLHKFKIMEGSNKSNTKKSFKVFHICEAPGQMILTAKYFAETKYPNITNYDWRANSLNPYNSENKAKYGKKPFGDDYGIIKNNPKQWLWGADDTGDITNVRNIKWFMKYIRDKWLDKSKNEKLDFIVGDGGLNTNLPPLLLQKLDLAQVITVLACSSIGGSCCIKHFTPYIARHKGTYDAGGFFMGFIYLYYSAFEETTLFKPYTSNPDSGEFYVVCKGFKGIESEQLEKLFNILDGFTLHSAIIEKENMPETFTKQVNTFIELMSSMNTMATEKVNMLIKCYNNMKSNNKNKNNKNNNKKNMKSDITNKLLQCDKFLNSDNIETILVPRYNQWIKLYEFE